MSIESFLVFFVTIEHTQYDLKNKFLSMKIILRNIVNLLLNDSQIIMK